jgi:predicted MFS family arabinose efflux permease
LVDVSHTGPPERGDRVRPGDARALASVAVQFFVNGAAFASFLPRLPEIRDRVGISDGTVGLFLTVAGACGLISSASVSGLIARFGTRRIMITGSVALLVVLPAVGFVRAPVGLLATLIALSMIDVVIDVAMNLQGSWLSARRRAPVMNRLHGLWSLGTVAGGIAAAQLATADVPMEIHLVGVSVVLLGAVAFVAKGLLRVDEPHAAPEGFDIAALPIGRWRPLLPLALGGAFAVAVEVTSSDWAAFRFTDDFGATAAFATFGYVAFTVGMTVGRFAGDSAVLRLGSDGLLRAACSLAFVGLLGATLLPFRYVALVSFALAGLGIATFFPKLYDDAARLPARGGAGLGALTAGSRAATLVAPVLIGTLVGSRLSVGTAMAIVALPCTVGLFLVEGRPWARRSPSRSGVNA